MSDQPPSRFAPQGQTTNERLSTQTVGLVALSDFRKRRAEVLEQQEREARKAQLPGTDATSTPTKDRSRTGTPAAGGDTASDTEIQPGSEIRKKKKQKKAKAVSNKLSFAGDEEDGEGDESGPVLTAKTGGKNKDSGAGNAKNGAEKSTTQVGKIAANSAVGVVPRALTKAALRKEAAEREALRKEFLLLQAAVKATEIAIPFVFYDGTNIPGGMVRVKKGDFIWVFLDKSRKVGAELAVGGEKNANARRDWARVGVDDLMLVRGTMIIPHHYDFYFFIMNKAMGPGNHRLFDYSAEAPPASEPDETDESPAAVPLSSKLTQRDIRLLEGASHDPTMTKVVDRRWYEHNKHIYPASVWQEFDPEKNYQNQIRRDQGGNAFFFSK